MNRLPVIPRRSNNHHQVVHVQREEPICARWSLFHSPLTNFSRLRTDIRDLKDKESTTDRRGYYSGGVVMKYDRAVELCLNDYPTTREFLEWEELVSMATEPVWNNRLIGGNRGDSPDTVIMPVTVIDNWREITIETMSRNFLGQWLLEDGHDGLCVIQAKVAKNRALVWIDRDIKMVGAIVPIEDQLYRYVYCASDQDEMLCSVPFAMMRLALHYANGNTPYSFSDQRHLWVDQEDRTNIIGTKYGKALDLFRDHLPEGSPLSTCDIVRCLLGGQIPKSIAGNPKLVTAFKEKIAEARNMSQAHRQRMADFVKVADEMDKLLRVRFEI